MPPRKRAGPTQRLPVQPHRCLPCQPSHCLRHALLRWNAPAYVHMVRHRLPFDPLKAGWATEFPQALPDVLAEGATDGLLPICRSDNEVVSAIPPYVALTLPRAHRGCSSSWPWRVHEGRNHIARHESTPERQSPFESHRQRRWLTCWSSAPRAPFSYACGLTSPRDECGRLRLENIAISAMMSSLAS